MLRALGFFLQIVLLVSVSIWIFERPGDVVFHVYDYKITLQMGIFLLVVFFSLIFTLLAHRFLVALEHMPEAYRHWQQKRRHHTVLQALTCGFAAIASGEPKKALHNARKAQLLIAQGYDKKSRPKEIQKNVSVLSLPLLLEAQAERLSGNHSEAQRLFEELTQNKDAAYLGMQGLLQTAVQTGDHEQALVMARKTLQAHPQQTKILQTVYELEVKTRSWDEALQTLKKARSVHAVTKERADHDEAALLTHLARRNRQKTLTVGLQKDILRKLERAVKLSPVFVPAVKDLANMLLRDGKNKKARGHVEKCWVLQDHPDLMDLWGRLAPKNILKKSAQDPTKRLRWYEKLLALHPKSYEGHLVLARVAMEDSLWEEASAYLSSAEKIHQTTSLYKLRAALESKTTHDENAVQRWNMLAAQAAPDRQWTCALTGRVYDHWSVIAEPHGSFNTMIWDTPKPRALPSSELIEDSQILVA